MVKIITAALTGANIRLSGDTRLVKAKPVMGYGNTGARKTGSDREFRLEAIDDIEKYLSDDAIETKNQTRRWP